MDSELLRTPPTELELAEALGGIQLEMTPNSGKRIANIIRRLAFERDMLKDDRKAMEQAVLSAASSIIDNWDDWDAEAQQAAQQDQDVRSWRHVLMTNIVNQLWREFDWPLTECE
jgi:hypothetical protein